jgi:hypothetical protein
MWSGCSLDQTIVPLLSALLSRDPVADVACAIHQLDASGIAAGEKIDVALAGQSQIRLLSKP